MLPLRSFCPLVSDVGAGAGHVKLDNYSSSNQLCGKIASNFDPKSQLILIKLVNNWVDAEGRIVVAIDSVVHDEEFAVGRIYYQRLH